MDFGNRLDSLQQMLNDVLGLLQQPRISLRGSQRPNSHTRAIMGHLDQLSKSFCQLKEDFQRLQSSAEEGRKLEQQTRGMATNGILGADGVNCRIEGNEGLRSADATFRMADMGFGLVKSLGRYGTNFSGKIHISDLEYLDLASISKRLADPDTPSSLLVQHTSTSKIGTSRIFVVEREEEGFDFPDFSDSPQLPLEYEKSFERIIASPPKQPIIYYVGTPLTPDFNTLLSPGKLLELGEVPGVTTPYWHAGDKYSGTAFHYEDGAIRSCNVTISGFKLWILINDSSNPKFEEFVESLYPSAAKQPRCGQWLRHLDILISPEKLKEMDIRFELVLAGPGDMVITAPGQYHAVLNLTKCFAIAINFALPEDPVLSPSLVCSQCGLYRLKHPDLEQLEGQVARPRRGRPARRQHEEHGSTAQSVVQPDKPELTSGSHGRDTLEDTADDVASAGKGGPVPGSEILSGADGSIANETRTQAQTEEVTLETRAQQVTEDVTPEHDSQQTSQLVDPAVNSTETASRTRSGLKRIPSNQDSSTRSSKRSKQRLSPPVTTTESDLQVNDQRCDIPSFNQMGSSMSKGLELFTMIRSPHAAEQFCNLVSAKRNTHLYKDFRSAHKGPAQHLVLLDRLGNSCKTMKHLSQYFLAVDVEKLLDGSLRMDPKVKDEIIQASGLTREKYSYHLARGKMWRRLCGAFDGILCFIPSDMHNPWKAAPNKLLEINEDELRELHNLLTDEYTTALCAAGKAFQQSLSGHDVYFTWETTRLSKPFHELSEKDRNFYIKPVSLLPEDILDTEKFPDWSDPRVIPPTEEQCEYCSSRSCNCYHSQITEVKRQIVISPGKGLCLQAISAEPKAVVYKNTDLIGFLTGKLIPPETLDDEQVFDSYKCQVDCRDEGNEFKLLQHACPVHAAARLMEKRVSGRFRLAVVAQKDIHDGEEITIMSHRRHKVCEQCKDGS